MATLTEEQKLLVVLRLACFVSPSDVVKELKLDYKVEATLQQLNAYDPANAAGRRLSKELKAEFERERARYLSDLSDVPLAHQAGRVRLLDDIARQAKSKGNLKMAMEAAEQAAKDMGGMFLNKLDPKQLSDEQLRRLLGLPLSGCPSSGLPAGPAAEGGAETGPDRPA